MAGHGKVSAGFSLSTQKRNPRDSCKLGSTCKMILTRLKIHVLLFRVLARFSVQEGNRGTFISRESILARVSVQKINRR